MMGFLTWILEKFGHEGTKDIVVKKILAIRKNIFSLLS